MTKPIFAHVMANLTATFRVSASPAQLDGYWLGLNELTDEEFKCAATKAIRTCKFMPVPAEILGLAGKGGDKTAEIAKAWDMVRATMDRLDSYANVDFGALVNAVIRNLGGWIELCEATVPELVWRRKEFERLYRALADTEIDATRGGPLRGLCPGDPVTRIAIGGPQASVAQLHAANGAGALVGALARQKS